MHCCARRGSCSRLAEASELRLQLRARLARVYSGSITRIGLDVGFTEGGTIAWAVYAPAEGGRGALAGNYGGATGEATIGGGLGANVLIGGLQRSIALQPVSVGAQRGLNAAVGIGGLELFAR